MAVRRESVRLELEDAFSREVLTAAASVAVLKKELGSLNGTAVQTSRGTDKISKDVEKVGRSSDTSSKQIDKFSGRLGILLKVAGALGPALVPIGAAAIPAISGLTTQLTLAVAAAGTAALAFQGVGDGLKALNDYQLEPTAENLQAMRIEMEKLGPDGAHFVQFLDSLSPQLRQLQMTARAGIFPGVEEGLTSLLTLGPQVNRIVGEIASAMGELSADAGAGLSGAKFAAFFDYLENNAKPILMEMGRTLGNFAEGIGAMIVAFAPLTADFSSGFESMSESFAKWAQGLTDNSSFAEFVAYVRESVPRVLDLIGSLADVFVGLIQAAAPVGAVILPALTSLVDVFAILVSSPIGSVFITAAAALSAYSLAASAAAAAQARLSAAMVSTLWSPWTVAVVGAVAAAASLAQSNAKAASSIESLNNATRSMDVEKMKQFREQTQAILDAEHPEEGTLGNYWDAVTGSFHDLIGVTGDMERAVTEANDALAAGGGLGDLFAQSMGLTAAELHSAAMSAEDFSGALAELNGWLDKRAALRDYRDGLQDLAKGLRNGFQQKDIERLDATAAGIAKVAAQIKDRGLREDFLQGARTSLSDLAEKSGPKAQAQIGKVISKLDQLGLTHAEPTIDANAKPFQSQAQMVFNGLRGIGKSNASPSVGANTREFKSKSDNVFSDLFALDRKTATPKVTVDGGQAIGMLGQIQAAIAGVRDKTVTITTKRAGAVGSLAGEASGGTTVPKTGLGYADRHLYLLADGEEVISNRWGQADRNRALLKKINAGRLADGGTTDKGKGGKGPKFGSSLTPELDFGSNIGKIRDELQEFRDALHDVNLKFTSEMSSLARQLNRQAGKYDKLSDRLDKATTSLADLRQASADYSKAVAGNFQHDLFGNGLAGFGVQAQADTNDANAFAEALASAVAQGLDGPLFDALAQSGDLTTAQQLAASGAGGIANYEQIYGTRQNATGGVGDYAAQISMGAAIKDAADAQRDAAKAVRESERTIRRLENRLEKLSGDVADGAEKGTRAGWDDQKGKTHRIVRTGGGGGR